VGRTMYVHARATSTRRGPLSAGAPRHDAPRAAGYLFGSPQWGARLTRCLSQPVQYTESPYTAVPRSVRSAVRNRCSKRAGVGRLRLRGLAVVLLSHDECSTATTIQHAASGPPFVHDSSWSL
jgi:hypothetical protein